MSAWKEVGKRLLTPFLTTGGPAEETGIWFPFSLRSNGRPGLDNFCRMSEYLYRGAQPSAEGYGELKKLGVKTVVNLRAYHCNRNQVEKAGLGYVHIPCRAWNPLDQEVARFINLLRNSATHPVFVHCRYGSDRTGLMAAAYRIIEERWNRDAAIEELHRFGYHALFDNIEAYLRTLSLERLSLMVDSGARRVGVKAFPLTPNAY